MRNLLVLSMVGLLVAVGIISPTLAENEPVVNAIMFWMDGCPHCHDVLDNVLPPLQQQYGDQFNILLIEIESIEDTEQLYQLGESAGLAKDQIGVPFLLIGDEVLVGSDQIHAWLPNLINSYLTAGGVAIPAYPALVPFLPEGTETEDLSDITAEIDLSSAEAGNGFMLAIVVLVGMVLSLGYAAITLWRARQGEPVTEPPVWTQSALPLLAVAGLIKSLNHCLWQWNQ